MDWDIKIFWNAGTSEVPLELQVETTSSSGATGMLRFLSQGSREMDPHLEMRRGKCGSSSVVEGHSVFLSNGDV